MMIFGVRLNASSQIPKGCVVHGCTGQLYMAVLNAQNRLENCSSCMIVGKPFVQAPTEYKNIEVTRLQRELILTLSFAKSRLASKATYPSLPKEDVRSIALAVNTAHHRLIDIQGHSVLKIHELEQACKDWIK
jgi:hypothetical protein